MLTRKKTDQATGLSMRGALTLVNIAALVIGLFLLWKSWPLLLDGGARRTLFSTLWPPENGHFGYLPFIAGTVAVTVLAMVLAVPICLLSALFISEYVPSRMRWPVRLGMDVMAGIPSVLYGLLGVIVIVPAVRSLGAHFQYEGSGYSLLAGGIVLALMVSPIIISVAVEVLQGVPRDAREAALSLGTTKWEVSLRVVARSAWRGLMSAVVLGFARAFGETMAVLMVVGNMPNIPRSIASLFDGVYPIPALIANKYGEMMSDPWYESSLLFGALLLLLVVGGFNLIAHILLARSEAGREA